MIHGDWVRKRFDAVIIGAGIGGLCAGAWGLDLAAASGVDAAGMILG